MKNLPKYLFSGLIIILAFYPVAFSQVKTFKGVVVSPDNTPVKNAQVSFKDSDKIVAADSAGCFSIESKSMNKIRITADGFIPKDFKISKSETEKTFILEYDPSKSSNFKIVFDDNNMNTVILNGRKVDITGYHNIYELVDGNVSGVLVYDTEGAKKIVIRGVSTVDLENNDPLIVIDGVQLDSRSLDNIAVQDIASLRIVKNSEASKYGSQGGNGVIEITTRKGRRN